MGLDDKDLECLMTLSECCRLITHVPQGPDPSATLFGDGMSKEVIKVQ